MTHLNDNNVFETSLKLIFDDIRRHHFINILLRLDSNDYTIGTFFSDIYVANFKTNPYPYIIINIIIRLKASFFRLILGFILKVVLPFLIYCVQSLARRFLKLNP